jgi:DNA repair ATPase RecN
MLLLAYADRVRALSTPELVQEIVRLGNPSAPAEQLQLALALSQLRQTPELARAQELLNRVTSSAAPDAQPLQPLARLLAARYSEQRRVEDQLEKQAQQLRDTQRRLDQTRERLEALKAIERSLTSRLPAPVASAATAATPTSAASAPTSRHRRSAP